MTDIILHAWHWVILGLFLIALESCGIGGMLLGAAASGFVIASIVHYYPDLVWSTQVICYGFLTIGFTWLYWHFFKPVNLTKSENTVNNRAAQLKGSLITLKQDLPLGEGKVQIADTLWHVKNTDNAPLQCGDSILVTGYSGMVLLVCVDNKRIVK
ncbi:MAG: NfeD family protein [Endozoicomonadaceae bacterium]|nr:NfeD family protein [Endozoicomonadaceae bacterium]MBE8233076.1 NfeD family protein [Endozoicomonadaceae bacterium]